MLIRPLLDVRDWSRFVSREKHPLWWGILGLIAIEVTVVSTFLASYYYLWIVQLQRPGEGSWPPPGFEVPPLFYPTINLGLLVTCAATMWYAGVALGKKKRRQFVLMFVICTVCGLAVLYLRWLQFQSFPFSWKDHAYASIVWTLTGFHFLHVASAVAGTAAIGLLGHWGYYDEERRVAVDVDTYYWYFVSLAWVPIYFSIYWAPRLG